MKIAINAAFNAIGGAKMQLINMAKLIPSSNYELDLIIYVNKHTYSLLKEEGDILENYKVVVCNIPSISTIFRYLWEQFVFPFLLLSKNIDVLLCVSNTAPLYSKGKRIQWIQTMGPFDKEFYQYFNLANKIKLYLNKIIITASAKRSDAVIFESKFTNQLFINKYNIRPERSHVINVGKDLFFYPYKSTMGNDYLNQYESYYPYALCVSHLYPYKNIERMLEAFRLALDHTGANLTLLIAGSKNYQSYTEKILTVINKLSLKKSVILLGSVSKKDLRDLYSKCEFLIFPSPFENFAYTLAEAMSCGVAITCSNTTAMPETCQDAALYFNPYDIKDMSQKIRILISDKELRLSLNKKSIYRAKELPDFKEATIEILDIIKSLSSQN